MNNSVKILLALATGTAAGIIAGLLCASEQKAPSDTNELEKKSRDLLAAALKKAEVILASNGKEQDNNPASISRR